LTPEIEVKHDLLKKSTERIFMQDSKKPDSGPVLKRDEHNVLDKDDAKKVTEDLVRKALAETKYINKEQSFHASGGKRDVTVFISLCIRNSVNGHVVVGDDQSKGFIKNEPFDLYAFKEFDQLTIDFPAKIIPMGPETAGKGLLTGFNVLRKWLISIGVLIG
jgi:hypothetical protein